VEAARRLSEVLPPSASLLDVLAKQFELHRQVLIEAGVRWPESLTPAALQRAVVDWHVFPNTIVLPSVDGALWYRSRPNGSQRESCIFDVWWLQRFAPGKQPPLRHDLYTELADFKGENPFLEQDFANLIATQRGIHSRGFEGARTSPVQEMAITNFHRALKEYLAREP
jgi:hypothetical protein